MSQNSPTFSPTDAAGPPSSQTPSSRTPPSQTPSSRAPPPVPPGLQLFHPPPAPPGLYRHPGPNGGQYSAAGMGMSAPQLYRGAPPYPPMPPLWGYGHFPPGAFPGPFPYPGDLQLTSNAPVPTNATQGRTEVTQPSGHAATSHPMASTMFQPKRNYPNKQVSEGGTLHMIRVELTLMHLKFGCLRSVSMRAAPDISSRPRPTPLGRISKIGLWHGWMPGTFVLSTASTSMHAVGQTSIVRQT